MLYYSVFNCYLTLYQKAIIDMGYKETKEPDLKGD